MISSWKALRKLRNAWKKAWCTTHGYTTILMMGSDSPWPLSAISWHTSLWCCTSKTKLPAGHTSRSLSWDTLPPWATAAHMAPGLSDWASHSLPSTSWPCSSEWMIWFEGLKESQRLTGKQFHHGFTLVSPVFAKTRWKIMQHQDQYRSISDEYQINIRSIPDQYQINIRSISRSISDQYHHQYQINIRPISGLITILNFKALNWTIFNIIEQHFFQSRDWFFSISDPQGVLPKWQACTPKSKGLSSLKDNSFGYPLDKTIWG